MKLHMYEIICDNCQTMNTYQTREAGKNFEGTRSIVEANEKEVDPGAKFFLCRRCQLPIKILD